MIQSITDLNYGITKPEMPPSLRLTVRRNCSPGSRSSSSNSSSTLKRLRSVRHRQALQKEFSHKNLKCRRKIIRFDLEDVLVGAHRADLTSEERRCMFWFGSETKRQARAEALALRADIHTPSALSEESSSTSIYLGSFRMALAACGSKNDKTPLPSIPVDSIVCSGRGLEPIIFPEMVHSRHRVVAIILNAQHKLPLTASPDQRASLLNAVSKNLSRPSRRMARWLGAGDSQVVAEEVRRFRYH